MGAFFLFAVLFLMVFLVLNSTRTRVVALGVLAFMAAIVTFYIFYIEGAEQQAVPPAADEKLKDTRTLAKKAALARQAIKTQELAVDDQAFGPAIEQIRGSDGALADRPNLFAWRFAGALKNLNAEYAVRDVIFRVRLFSCPDFVTGDLDLADLEIRCNTIGDRRVGFYDLGIEPGNSAKFEETVTFDNQPAPGNWRYHADMASVTARIE